MIDVSLFFSKQILEFVFILKLIFEDRLVETTKYIALNLIWISFEFFQGVVDRVENDHNDMALNLSGIPVA